MGRKRKKLIKITRKSLPKVFNCPQCGICAVRVIEKEEEYKVICGSCSLKWTKRINKKIESIDIYNLFVDEFIIK